MMATCFEIKAPFGTFKDPRTTSGYFTFPFPPKTALIGLMGAILGIPHNECYQEDHFLARAKVSLQLLAIPRFMGCRTNETQTHAVQNISGIKIGYPSPGSGRGFGHPRTSTAVVNAWYRVFVIMDEEERTRLNERLAAHEYTYPPYLGRANMLAELDYLGEVELAPASPVDLPILVISVFDIGAMNAIEGSYVVVPQMPNGYDTEEKNTRWTRKKDKSRKSGPDHLLAWRTGKETIFRRFTSPRQKQGWLARSGSRHSSHGPS